jgi:hypothetical protein
LHFQKHQEDPVRIFGLALKHNNTDMKEMYIRMTMNLIIANPSCHRNKLIQLIHLKMGGGVRTTPQKGWLSITY